MEKGIGCPEVETEGGFELCSEFQFGSTVIDGLMKQIISGIVRPNTR